MEPHGFCASSLQEYLTKSFFEEPRTSLGNRLGLSCPNLAGVIHLHLGVRQITEITYLSPELGNLCNLLPCSADTRTPRQIDQIQVTENLCRENDQNIYEAMEF